MVTVSDRRHFGATHAAKARLLPLELAELISARAPRRDWYGCDAAVIQLSHTSVC